MKKISFFIFILISLFSISCSKNDDSFVEEKYQGKYILSSEIIEVSQSKIKFLDSGKEYTLHFGEDEYTYYFKKGGKEIICDFYTDVLTIDSKSYIKETENTIEAKNHFNSFLNMNDFLLPDGKIENTLEKDNTFIIFVENEYLSPDDYVSYLDSTLIPLGYVKITDEEYYGESMGESTGTYYEKYDGDLYKIAFSNSNEKKQCSLQCTVIEEANIHNINIRDFKELFKKNTNLDIDLGDKVKGVIGLMIYNQSKNISATIRIDEKIDLKFDDEKVDEIEKNIFEDLCDHLDNSLPSNYVRINRISKITNDIQTQETVFVFAEEVDGKPCITSIQLTDENRYYTNQKHSLHDIKIIYEKQEVLYQSRWNECEYKINDYIGRKAVNIVGYPGNCAYIVDKLENYGSHITYYLFLCDNRWYDNWYNELAKVGFTKIDGGYQAVVTDNESKYLITIEIKEYDTHTEFSFTSYVTK